LIIELYFVHNLVVGAVINVYSTSFANHTESRRKRRSEALARSFALLAGVETDSNIFLGVDGGWKYGSAHEPSASFEELKVHKSTITNLLGRLRPQYSVNKLKVFMLNSL
jgi:hypothetical protein